MTTIGLSLVSHTNVGKTTLARTLTRRDVGEVRDEAHVTQEAERAVLIETPEGDRLELWDTPGFGDSVRLARRLEQAGTPIGWFLSEVWDRFRDRAFWSSQRALRNVVDSADVVLYLVDANQPPESAPWLAAELRVLEKLGKPVIALLNQLGAPRAPADEAAERDRWRGRLAALSTGVRDVLALDAFARCWVQEDVLLEAVARALPASRREAADRLRTAWRGRAEAVWAASAELIAGQLQDTVSDEEPVDEAGWAARMRTLGTSVGAAVGSAVGSIAGGSEGRRAEPLPARQAAMARLGDRAAERVRTNTDALIRLHGLDGRAAPVVLERVASRYAVQAPLSEGKAALWGGALTGALAGLKADIASGGLTLGGGLLAGGLLGALGAVGLARGFNLVRGR
nr:GTPase domain-containing protein [Ideonella sp.]